MLIAAKNQDRDEFVAESADLIYHLLVAMVGGRRPSGRGLGGARKAPGRRRFGGPPPGK